MNWMDNFADEMNKTATIYSRTYVPDGMGGGYPDNIYKGLARYTNLDIM